MRVGVATVDITPQNSIWLTGFASRTEPSSGAYQPLEATAVVLESGSTRLALLAADLIGVDEFLLEPVRGAAAGIGVPPEHMLVNCSHTHCAPAVRRVRGSCRNFDEAYLASLKDKLVSTLHAAVDDLQPAVVDWVRGTCTLGINRRRVPDGGTEAAMLPNPEAPADTDVPVLRVRTPEGEVRALLFSYACHPTTMGGQQVGPDYPGFAREFIRSRIPGCRPVFLQGCGGDVKPRNVTADGRFASGPLTVVREIGNELGRAVLAALCGQAQPVGDGLAGAATTADLPANGRPTDEELDRYARESAWGRAYAEAARRLISRDGGLAQSLPVEVQVLSIGDLHLVAMGGEISCEIGLAVKNRLAGKSVWTLGYSNLLRCYVASRAAHATGGYEVQRAFLYSLVPEPRPLGLLPESADILVDTCVALVDRSRRTNT